MPKLKTKKAVAKRFKLTKTRKIKFFPGGKSHLSTSKEPERLRKLKGGRAWRAKGSEIFKKGASLWINQ